VSRAVEGLWYPEREPLARKVALSPLSLLSAGVGVAARLRAGLYRAGLLRAVEVEGVRVISVGNLNVGGTGKTPAVIALAQRLRARARVAVVTRGYGREGSAPVELLPGAALDARRTGDEPRLISERAGVPVLVDADRVRATRRARDVHGAQVVLLDDGMQHLRLARGLDVVVVDEAVGFGNGRVLPRGPLREPLTALNRAGLIWLRESSRPVPLPPFSAPVVRVRYVASGWVGQEGAVEPLESLRGQRVVALCGIARPSSFEKSLEEVGVERLRTFAFADHHAFTAAELARVQEAATALGARIVTTEKDRVRLPSGFGAWALRLEVQFLAGEEVLDRLLLEGPPGPPSGRRQHVNGSS
jgi:tetraacyldisaccharide 4'-kinase